MEAILEEIERMVKQRSITTSGKKKTAVARATIQSGKGTVRINKKPMEIYEPELARRKIMEPVMMAGDMANKVDIDVTISGGGFMGQADAARTAIARGLVGWSEDSSLRDAYLKIDRTLFVSDVRQKEPKKFGGRGARAKKQKSYR